MSQDEDGKDILMNGWLLKWTNYVKGYKKRWFKLISGTLTYYREKTANVHTQRGSITLADAIIHTHEKCGFVITKIDLNTVFYLKAATEIERDNWITALEIAKVWAINHRELLDNLEKDLHYRDHDFILMTIVNLGTNLEAIHKSYAIVDKYGCELKKQLTGNAQNLSDIPVLRKIYQCASLFKKTSSDMTITYVGFTAKAEVEYNRVYQLLQNEVIQIKTLERLAIRFDNTYRLLHTAITKKNLLNFKKNTHVGGLRSLRPVLRVKSLSSFDIVESNHNRFVPNDNGFFPDDIKSPATLLMMSSIENKVLPVRKSKKRRTRIPDKPNYPLSLWGVMKNCIGKDLSKIPMPVNFSEPLSFLQRAAEDFTYSEILNAAASCKESDKQLAYLAAFVVSSYATTAIRIAKPFNPLLGETYEWDRTDDLGWRLISEQVSHHPPIAAQYCESNNWTCWQEFAMSSKFRGKYLMIVPLGTSRIKFNHSGNYYSWTKVTTVVNNIIIGKLWVDNSGETKITNHKDSSVCHLNFIPYSIFRSEDQRKVTGEVKDREGNVKWLINGRWDTEIRITPVLGLTGKDTTRYITGEPILAWQAAPPPDDSHKYYNFSLYACQLNELEDNIAPTDSRFRPDQRLMEDGRWDEANTVKIELEEKQRAKNRQVQETKGPTGNKELIAARESTSSLSSSDHMTSHDPVWFRTEIDPNNGKIMYIYKGGYWEAKSNNEWDMCPNIF